MLDISQKSRRLVVSDRDALSLCTFLYNLTVTQWFSDLEPSYEGRLQTLCGVRNTHAKLCNLEYADNTAILPKSAEQCMTRAG